MNLKIFQILNKQMIEFMSYSKILPAHNHI